MTVRNLALIIFHLFMYLINSPVCWLLLSLNSYLLTLLGFWHPTVGHPSDVYIALPCMMALGLNHSERGREEEDGERRRPFCFLVVEHVSEGSTFAVGSSKVADSTPVWPGIIQSENSFPCDLFFKGYYLGVMNVLTNVLPISLTQKIKIPNGQNLHTHVNIYICFCFIQLPFIQHLLCSMHSGKNKVPEHHWRPRVHSLVGEIKHRDLKQISTI